MVETVRLRLWLPVWNHQVSWQVPLHPCHTYKWTYLIRRTTEVDHQRGKWNGSLDLHDWRNCWVRNLLYLPFAIDYFTPVEATTFTERKLFAPPLWKEIFQIVKNVTSCCNTGTNELKQSILRNFSPVGSLKPRVTHAPPHTTLDHFMASMYWLNLSSILRTYTTQLKLGIPPNFFPEMLVKTEVFCSKIYIVHLVIYLKG